MNFRDPNNSGVKTLENQNPTNRPVDPPAEPKPQDHSFPDEQTSTDHLDAQYWDPDSNEDNYWDDGAATP